MITDMTATIMKTAFVAIIAREAEESAIPVSGRFSNDSNPYGKEKTKKTKKTTLN